MALVAAANGARRELLPPPATGPSDAAGTTDLVEVSRLFSALRAKPQQPTPTALQPAASVLQPSLIESQSPAAATRSTAAAAEGGNLVPTEMSLAGWKRTNGRVPSLAKGANTTLRVRRWWAPSGQVLESVWTSTDPPFEFAYNPYDSDMAKMLNAGGVLEPTLTQLWGEQTRGCCSTSNGLVVDVGGNFGWYTLYSVALSCSVVVFEPVPAYQEVMKLGLSLNPGFASRVQLFGNVVFDQPGSFTLNVPDVLSKLDAQQLGIAAMDEAVLSGRGWNVGAHAQGVAKKNSGESHVHTARAASVRIDDLVERDICRLKADVEGFEPQVMQTAARLLSLHSVPVVQLELSKTLGSRNQTCAAVHMLRRLDALGYTFRQAPRPYEARDHGAGQVMPFPLGNSSSWERVYRRDFWSFSTNLIAERSAAIRWPTAVPWPLLDECATVPFFDEPLK